MASKKLKRKHDDDLEGAPSQSSKVSNELKPDQKIIVLEKCLPKAKILFSKQGVAFSRDAQNSEWDLIAKMCEEESIEVGGWLKLKNTVRNWFNRATVSFLVFS